jgi:AraC-like DNA-binding protein
LVNPDARGKAPPLEKVRQRIDAECCERLRLRDLSALAGVSATRLLRAFEAAYGLTPHRYQQSRRIARAKKMVVAGTPLAEIAFACGYSDQSHLNRWFLRIQGTTPGRLRRAFLS